MLALLDSCDSCNSRSAATISFECTENQHRGQRSLDARAEDGRSGAVPGRRAQGAGERFDVGTGDYPREQDGGVDDLTAAVHDQ